MTANSSREQKHTRMQPNTAREQRLPRINIVRRYPARPQSSPLPPTSATALRTALPRPPPPSPPSPPTRQSTTPSGPTGIYASSKRPEIANALLEGAHKTSARFPRSVVARSESPSGDESSDGGTSPSPSPHENRATRGKPYLEFTGKKLLLQYEERRPSSLAPKTITCPVVQQNMQPSPGRTGTKTTSAYPPRAPGYPRESGLSVFASHVNVSAPPTRGHSLPPNLIPVGGPTDVVASFDGIPPWSAPANSRRI